MSWWTGSAVGLDFETDGRDPTDARIVTFATVQINPQIETSTLELMAKPERPIPDEAASIHGISTERAEAEGIERELVVEAVVEQLAAAGETCPVVGHNVSYDLTVLDREMRRTGVGRLAYERNEFALLDQVSILASGAQVACFPVIDTYVLDKALDRYRPGKRQLSIAAEYYGVPMAEGAAHGATADVLASLRIAWKIYQRCTAAIDYIACNGDDPMPFRMHPFMRWYGGRRDPLELVKVFAAAGEMTLTELHHAQIGWSKEQADGLRYHFFRQGKKDEAASVNGAWPLQPLDVDSVTTIPGTTLI